VLRIDAVSGSYSVRVFNMTGQQVYETRVKSGSVNLNTSTWRNGYYLVQVQGEAGSRTFKALIAHP
jgi:hypothetical protein